ncbi:MAG: type III secretion system inner membrane ring subunit SctD [Janthinobacterium lividum]
MKRKNQDSFIVEPEFHATATATAHGATLSTDVPDDTGFDAADAAALEFRVLAGLHAGARFAWPSAVDAVLRVGARDDCDIVLQDAALASRTLHIRLAPDRRGWRVRETAAPAPSLILPRADADDVVDEIARSVAAADEAANGTETALALGQVLVLSTLALTVAAAGTRWPPPDAVLPGNAHPARTPTPHTDGMPGVPLSDAAAPDVAMSPTPAAPADATRDTASASAVAAAQDIDAAPVPDAPAAPHERRRRAGFIRAGAIVTAVALAVALASWLTSLPRTGARSAAPAHAAPPPNQTPATVTKLLERLGLAQRLHLETTADGLIAVTGWLPDTAQRDALADALAQLTPMPALRILIETEAVTTAQQLAETFGTMIDARYDGDGRIDLSGAIDGDTQRDALREAFRAQLPGAVLIDRHLLGHAALEQSLRDALRDAGMAGARVAWTTAALEIDAPAGTDADRFARALTAFRRVYGRRLPLLARIGANPAPFVATGLPFAIMAVTGGALPSVVVAGGGRLLPGGQYRGYRLVAVEAGRIVFDGPRRVIVAR